MTRLFSRNGGSQSPDVFDNRAARLWKADTEAGNRGTPGRPEDPDGAARAHCLLNLDTVCIVL